jgi:hypothetical protein
MAPLWVLVAAAIRALQFTEVEGTVEQASVNSTAALNPYMAYR